MGHLSRWEHRLSATPSHKLRGRTFCLCFCAGSFVPHRWGRSVSHLSLLPSHLHVMKSSRMACACSTLIPEELTVLIDALRAQRLLRKGFFNLRQSLFARCARKLTSNGMGNSCVYNSFIRLSMHFLCGHTYFYKSRHHRGLSEDKLFRIPYRCF